MRIRKATEKDSYESLKIVKGLDKWFTENDVKSMPIDFKVNNIVTAVDKNKVLGFLCYSSWEGAMKINWLAVKPEYHGNGVGTFLIDWLEKRARQLNSEYLLVETISDRYKNKHYDKTREFYYKQGFRKFYYLTAVRRGWTQTMLLEKKVK
jgi:N-acetylglutamate synthase-like GNAT family acetyltransferase